MTKTTTRTKMESDIADALAHLLADTYLLYLKTQNFHWNVTGPNFYSLHKMLEEQYEQLADAADLLAERLRALSVRAPGSFAEFMKLAGLDEASDESDAKQMIASLLKDHEAMAASITRMFEIAEDEGDEVTLDMLIQRKTEHDKTAWMLRSTLEK